jgi:predicted RNA-binding protein with PIN domain
MPLLIDGYNLLYSTGIVGRGEGPGGWERSRLALLNFLAASIEPKTLRNTTIVFDAQNAPWGLLRTINHQGMTVRFASQYDAADDLIEELIQESSSPRRLTVVSSDHRIQRAALRRRAKAVDSDVWYAELLRSRERRKKSEATKAARPAVPLLAEDVNYWMRQFGGETALAEFLERESATISTSSVEPFKTQNEPIAGETEGSLRETESQDASEPAKKTRSRKKATSGEVNKLDSAKGTSKTSRRRRPIAPDNMDKPRAAGFESLDNPFPPGYGEDLLNGDE